MSDVKTVETQIVENWAKIDETFKKANTRAALCDLVGVPQLTDREKHLVASAVKQAKQEIVADLIAAGVV